MERKNRSSNFELMRIFAMLLIVAYHYVLFTRFMFVGSTITVNRLFYQSMLLDGKTGVNLFVMLSGYFMIQSHGVKTQKVLQLWGQTMFYILAIWFLFHKQINGFGTMPQDTLLGKVLFLSTGVQWFIATYLVMYLLSPFLNKMLLSLSRTMYRRMLVLTGIFWCFIPTLSWIPGMIPTDFQGSDLMFFLFLYSVGAYLRLYHEEGKKKASFWFLCALGIFLLCMVLVAAVDIWIINSVGRLNILDYLFDYQNHVLIMLLSLFLFLGFKNLKVKNNRVINFVSSLTFGIYLIHDNWQIRSYLWNNIVKGTRYMDMVWFIPMSYVLILAMFIACGIIEWMRQHTIEKLWMKVVDWASPRINDTIDKWLS